MSHDEDESSVTSTASHGRTPTPSVSSPAATGGAGTFFEQHVGAYWLAHLLVSGIPPILTRHTVSEVAFQTERLGWHTDDFLVTASDATGDTRRLIGQVKRSFAISAADAECKKTFLDFWSDFNNRALFNSSDHLVLVILRGTNTMLEHFAGLLEFSRASRDGGDFQARLQTRGLASNKLSAYFTTIHQIVRDNANPSASTDDVWQLLRSIHLVSLDLFTSTHQTQSAVQTLLAHTSIEPENDAAATISWNSLLQIAAGGMAQARTFTRDDLPPELIQRHSRLRSEHHGSLRALRAHSDIILASIKSTIGSDHHLERFALVNEIVDKCTQYQLVIVSGGPGSGKSAAAKSALRRFESSHFVFCFRAEEFAQPHIDQALAQAGFTSTTNGLSALLAGQGRKILLVESIERILEAPTRDAFSDLLTLAQADRSWTIVLTCRDYSTDFVIASFLSRSSLAHAVTAVPPLTDDELTELESTNPTLSYPLRSKPLRSLLRTPYIVDKATSISWPSVVSLPAEAMSFRHILWRDIVRVEHHAAHSMPQRRESAFVEIALRRARSLSLYVSRDGIDSPAVDALLVDSLLQASRANSSLVAPSHDVLEDWAILHWLENGWVSSGGSPATLCNDVGGFPAIRRSLRQWIYELAPHDADTVDVLFSAALTDSSLPPQFCDDVVISVLNSEICNELLNRHRTRLCADNHRLLLRLMHLLRVGCTASPALGATSPHFLPLGRGWASVLRLTHSRLQHFRRDDRMVILDLLESWMRGISPSRPMPDGSGDAAAIAHWLLPLFGGYNFDRQRKRTLKVIAAIPAAAPDKFADLMTRAPHDGLPDQPADELRQLIFTTFACVPACRDLPDLILSLTPARIEARPKEYDDESISTLDLKLEPYFGISGTCWRGFFPASAYRGVVLPLLRYHADRAVDLVLRLVNSATEAYALPTLPRPLERPHVALLRYGDGSTTTQWCSARLWNLYRGTSVGPDVLQCILMALEAWLLEMADDGDPQLDQTLLYLLRHTTSASITAVVAGVATAYPWLSNDALLVLVRSRWCIQIDIQRRVSEHSAPSVVSKMMPDASNVVYENERAESDALPHRAQHLEFAVLQAQFGPHASMYYAVLDKHLAELPPLDAQDESDKLWRLAIHRMDRRQRDVVRDELGSSVESRTRFRLELRPPDEDIRVMVQTSARELEQSNRRMGLLMWAIHCFERDTSKADPGEWPLRLGEAIALGDDRDDVPNTSHEPSSRGLVAAISIRDHWDEMDTDARQWCLVVTSQEIARGADRWDQSSRRDNFQSQSTRACGWAISCAISKVTPTEVGDLIPILAAALFHPNEQVRWYASVGAGDNLWATNKQLLLEAARAVTEEATEFERLTAINNQLDYDERRGWNDILSDAANHAHMALLSNKLDATISSIQLQLQTAQGQRAAARVAYMFSRASHDPDAETIFHQLAAGIPAWWSQHSGARRGQETSWLQADHDAQGLATDILARFLHVSHPDVASRVVVPVLATIASYPHNVAAFIKSIAVTEDRDSNPEHFWHLWSLFAGKAVEVPWATSLDDPYNDGHELISVLFLALDWKDGVRDWRAMTAHEREIPDFFRALPPSAASMAAFSAYLYSVGERSLPNAFADVADRLRVGDRKTMFQSTDTLWHLESVLMRYVHNRPIALKRHQRLRDDILEILDAMIEAGSPAAFRMRDDFVTPLPPGSYDVRSKGTTVSE